MMPSADPFIQKRGRILVVIKMAVIEILKQTGVPSSRPPGGPRATGRNGSCRPVQPPWWRCRTT
jgi:hypothetical protein